MSDTSTIHLIKKYANRRLYDSHTSTHITLQDIRNYVIEEIPFQVVEAKSGEDITRSILLQIIQDAETDGDPIFSSQALKNIIRFYGPFQGMLGSYLEKTLESVMEIQKQSGMPSTEAWTDFMSSQMPVMQKVMQEYLERTKQLYMNTQNMFGLFPNFPTPFNQSKKKEEN
ncbi:polyhydroxyalkanoate synthesis repressor PhaR [Entomomonas sp. E2T0]|uniref:polyhydroxyalkanoate synthesis repressor PhaR n=1 Tax=Entomomonas sp. E2T0 TaxID=2930213 RepID=UPI0022281924|nr:polyhydroxyalkanoate synthesis repressor PhaR [Entomomonas sp. E2T0]UYZ85248.1 polyhydroxyalkanoate synthesis repressor PhaR [Entomomonas sp. E2T0]